MDTESASTLWILVCLVTMNFNTTVNAAALTCRVSSSIYRTFLLTTCSLMDLTQVQGQSRRLVIPPLGQPDDGSQNCRSSNSEAECKSKPSSEVREDSQLNLINFFLEEMRERYRWRGGDSLLAVGFMAWLTINKSKTGRLIYSFICPYYESWENEDM